MTAQVAVLNANGIAIASDSAVTVSDGEQSRSYQSADKIFPIHGSPLAVLHSGNAKIWGVPWQLLVEMWAQIRDGEQSDSVEASAREFRTWLAAQHALSTEAAQDDFFRWTVRDYLLAVRTRIRKELAENGVAIQAGHVDGPAGAQIDSIADDFIEMLLAREDFRDMDDVDAAAVCERVGAQLEEDFAWVFDDTPSTPKLQEQARKIAQMLVHKAEPFKTDSVLAFAGYGKNDYFPSIYQMTVSGVVGGVVRIYDDSLASVSADNPVSITPLGLTEAIHAFLRGTSPQYRATAHQVLNSYIEDDDGKAQGDASDRAHARLDSEFDALEWNQFLSPMLDIVETLPLVEMVRLADSLVGLASLRQLIEGKTSVGGPIDLARVTKDGGFAWVRSKGAASASSFAR